MSHLLAIHTRWLADGPVGSSAVFGEMVAGTFDAASFEVAVIGGMAKSLASLALCEAFVGRSV